MSSGASAGTSTGEGEFNLRFWGVRGGIPTTNAQTRRFGGNTPCIEVHCGDHLIIFEAGTGIRPFGPGGSIEQNLTDLMTSPLFPIPLSFIGGLKGWGDFIAGDEFEPREGIRVRTAALNNPSGATGYRIEYGGKVLGYVSNTGHRLNQPDETVLALIEDCDLVVYDSYYNDEEVTDGELRGHSTWQEGLRLCQAAGAKRMAAFQHHPDHLDDELDQVQAVLEARLPGSFVAAEGQIARL